MAPFSGVTLDRACALRSDRSWVAEKLEDPDGRAVAANSDGVLLEDGLEPRLARRPLRPQSGLALGTFEPILLGLDRGKALFAIDLDALGPNVRASCTKGARVVSLRDAGVLLPRPEGGLAAYLVALLNWHRRHRFCANCGNATILTDAGYSRHCPSCGAHHFPRTDPVVIMLVENAGHLLLGRRGGWPPGRYSVLAGFVSPGESAEEAVMREVREESGIHVYDPRFVTSQPWPFPSSLMLGFEARSDGGDPSPRDGELVDVRWFPLDAVLAARQETAPELVLPPTISIARLLIEQWLARTARLEN